MMCGGELARSPYRRVPSTGARSRIKVKYSLRLQPADMASLTAMDAAVRRADALDFGSVWSSEAGHDPFIAMPLAAAASPRLKLGTGVAVAYGRSPFATAQVAWDIQRYSE